MKNKKLIILIGVLLSLFIIFLFLYNKKIDYEVTYLINEYEIVEVYYANENIYEFSIDNNYNLVFSGEYSLKREKITNVTIEDSCIYLDGNIEFYDVCVDEDKYYFSNINVESDYSDSYNNFKIYDTMGFSYFIWDYNGFIYINDEETKKISIFVSDVYNPSLIKQVGDYLFIPNYDEDYYFSSYYLVNMKKSTVKEISLDIEISFDIAYLSYTDNSISIYDKKNEKVYSIKLSSGNQTSKQGVTYTESELNSYIDENEYFFIENNNLKYVLNDFEIYLNDYDINDIVYENIDSALFLENDVLFYFSLGKSVTKVLEYSEWSFNYDNLIFIY